MYRAELHFLLSKYIASVSFQKIIVIAYLSIYVKFDMQPIQIFKSPWQRTGGLLVAIKFEFAMCNFSHEDRKSNYELIIHLSFVYL